MRGADTRRDHPGWVGPLKAGDTARGVAECAVRTPDATTVAATDR
jgi:hypothetical protein